MTNGYHDKETMQLIITMLDLLALNFNPGKRHEILQLFKY